MKLEAQVAALEAAYVRALDDAVGDYGQGTIDAGGWSEIARAVCDVAGPEITPEAKAEWLRMQGVPT